MIGGGTFLMGVIGHPLGHTRSPALHNAALRHAGLDGVYLALPTRSEALGAAIAAMRAWHLVGLNVTLPHKVAVIPLLDELTATARGVGAVNTIAWEGERLVGDNTDVAGFQAQAAELLGPGVTAAVLGAGGAARAVFEALGSAGAARVDVVARSPAPGLLAALRGRFPDTAWACRGWGEPGAPVELLIQTTPVGMAGAASPLTAAELSRLDPRAVLDLVYTPATTQLLALARAQGRIIRSGETMFLAQAAAAFRRWTGVQVPRPVWEAALASVRADDV